MKKTSWMSVILFFMLIPMLLHADIVTDGARYGLLLWYNSVVPALFPFMVLSGMIVSYGGVPVIMEPFYRLLHPFLPISKDGCYVLVSGLLCGYPMGAKLCSDFVDEGRISLHEGKFLMAICNHPSPMFLLGYVYPFFSKNISCWVLLVSVYGPVIILASAANLLYFKFKIQDEYKKSAYINNLATDADSASKCEHIKKQTADEAILSSISVLCKIGGYLVLFSILIVFLRKNSTIPESLRLFLIGALEMTTGIREIAATLPYPEAFICSIAALTFGGCSGIFQTKAVLNSHKTTLECESKEHYDNKKTAGLSIRPYIFWKLTHAALSAGIAAFLCSFH